MTRRQEGNVDEPASSRGPRSFPQKRARETRRKLLDSARRTFEEKGYDETQTPDIAKNAGVSVGTFYRYFGDKREAFIEMSRAHLGHAFDLIVDKLDPEAFAKTRSEAERRAAVDHVLDVLFQNARERPALNRVFLGVALRDPEVGRLREEFEEKGREVLASLLEAVVPGELPNPAASAEVVQLAARELALATAGSGRPNAEVDALRSALADMIYRYVFARGDAP